MRHVIDEIVLDLCQLLLPEDNIDGKDESHQQN